MNALHFLFPVLLACSAPLAHEAEGALAPSTVATLRLDTLMLVDTIRQRAVPVAIYRMEDQAPKGLVILSHGYGANNPGTYLRYSYLAKHLAQNGYLVCSVQHELAGDDLLPMKGDLRSVRRQNWERGSANILFVLNAMKERYPAIGQVDLIGHSNGGDMSLLFAEQHPDLMDQVITLDNLRYPLPLLNKPRIASIRASDTHADEGVLPSETEQAAFHIRIVIIDQVAHVEMDDRGSDNQKARINALLLELLISP